MSNYSFRLDVSTTGEHTEEELIEFIKYSVGCGGSLSMDSPFIDEDGSADVVDVSID